MNATELLEAAEYLLFILDVSQVETHSLFISNAMDRMRKVCVNSREPLKVDNGQELPFKDC